MKKKFKCKNCKKETTNAKFCSRTCYFKYLKNNNLYFHNKKFQSKMGKRGGHNGGKAIVKINRKLKKGPYFNKKLRHLSVLKSLQKRREYSNIKFKNNYFDSRRELEFAMCVYYQLGILLKERKNCHVLVGKKEFDFYINNIYIEVHPITNTNVDLHNVHIDDYTKERKNILLKNNIKNNLLIIT